MYKQVLGDLGLKLHKGHSVQKGSLSLRNSQQTDSHSTSFTVLHRSGNVFLVLELIVLKLQCLFSTHHFEPVFLDLALSISNLSCQFWYSFKES